MSARKASNAFLHSWKLSSSATSWLYSCHMHPWYYTMSRKNVPPLACYNFDMFFAERLLIK